VTFNVKSRYALAVRNHVIALPAGHRHGITGFWAASAWRVQNERLVRIAYLHDRRFVLEAEIDAEGTHVMVQGRFDEYIAHEVVKRADERLPVVELRREIQNCIDRGRIIVAFRNARAIDGDIEYSGRNPVWYSEE